MPNFNKTDKDLICKTILVGLPGVGKSTLSETMCEMFEKETNTKLESVSSDLKVRAVRSDSNNPVLKNFMKKHHIPDEDFPMMIDTNKFMQKYGEPCFRDLESDVIVDMLEKGEFKGKMPNLGGKAILHPKTAEVFKKAGYNIIYLKADSNTVAKHVAKDFERWLNGAVVTRSNINGPILETLKEHVPHMAQKPSAHVIDDLMSMTEKAITPEDKKKLEAEKKQYLNRLLKRNEKAGNIISQMLSERDEGYQKASNQVLHMSGDVQKDVSTLINMLHQNSIMKMNKKSMER